MSLSGKEVAEIARLLDQSRFTELKLEIGEFRLRIRREGGGGHDLDEPNEPPPILASPALQASTPVVAAQAGETDVLAPFLGTFYHAPRPGDPPFISIGQQVKQDTTIGIIEVMKLMNPVRAGVAGTVTAVMCTDGEAIEAGRPLIRVRA
jgi:acetyl-CoA carboxylase biotin carboxyl carrier protein